MIVALIILCALVGVGLLLWLLHKPDDTPDRGPGAPAAPSAPASSGGEEEESGECCGMHMTCEKDSLLAAVSAGPDYFDDEELDRFAGRPADGYSREETEEFRDVLLTLLPDDIAPWARSLQLRGITLPADVREELLLIVAEARAAKAHAEK